MSRKPTRVHDETIISLRQLVIQKSGLGCTSYPDIQLLQFKIKKDTDEYLSIQTLNRFFGLIKNDFKPAMATLNILACYVGYHSFSDFEFMRTSSPTVETPRSLTARLIVALFSGVQPGDPHELGLLDVFKNISQMLEKDPGLAEDIYPFMAANEFGRRYFFEQFVNIDALDSHYGEGLNLYFLHTSSREQRFFVYCLFTLRYFLTSDHRKFNYYHGKLLDYPFSEIRNFHPFLIGRYFCAQVYNSILSGQAIDIDDEALPALRELDNRPDQANSYPYAYYILGEALVLAGEFEQAFKLLQPASWRLGFVPPYMQDGYINQFRLLQLYAGYYAGKLRFDRAKEEFAKISQGVFCMQSESFYGILMLRLLRSMLPAEFTSAHASRLDSLIRKTGFVYFMNKDLELESVDLLLMDNKGKKIG